jgi:hypothetical protein
MLDVEKLFILNYMKRIEYKLSLQGRFFFQIMNYQGPQYNQVNLYEFFLIGT